MSTETREDRLDPAHRRPVRHTTRSSPPPSPTRPSTAAADEPGLRLPAGRPHRAGGLRRPARARRSAPSTSSTDPATGRTTAEAAAPLRHHHLRPAVGPRAGRSPARCHDAARAARRPGRHPRLHQRRLHHHRHRADPTRRGVACRCRPAPPSAAAAADRHRDRADADRVEHRLSSTTPSSSILAGPRPAAAGGVRLPPRGRRPARGPRRRHGAAGRTPPSSSRPWPTCSPAARALHRAELASSADGDDPLALLIYTSGSTGAPKGAMYPESKVANMWRAGGQLALGRRTRACCPRSR